MTHDAHTFHAEVKELEAQPTLSIRLRTPVQQLPARLAKCYEAVMAYLAEHHLRPAGPPFVAYYNDDMSDLDIEAGVPVAVVVPGRGAIQAGCLPAMRAATCIHVGPYSELHHTYSALNDWIRANGHEGTGMVYEHYLNDPAEVASEALETEIVMPLKEAA